MDKSICSIIIIFLIAFSAVIEALSYVPCQYIQLKLFNDILEFQESRQGLYELNENVNGKYSWKSTTNLSLFRDAQAIWYIPQSNSWSIGKFSDIGTETVGIYTSGNQADTWSPLDVPWDEWEFYAVKIGKGDIIMECTQPPLQEFESDDLIDLIGPLDVGGQCPSPTYEYTYAGEDYCCCGDGCCWDKCTWSTPPADCIENVAYSQWIYLQDLDYHKAIARKFLISN